ncbi:MAG: hypothetical protein BroJett030_01810 [Alphaproteobacteria bacterium]|nr:MAG: hypothetical protein BroJett030_01810 [Alphaproteobacteria bacterium]
MSRKLVSLMIPGLLAILLVAAGQSGASAEKRVALVIGNSKYVHAAELRNPSNDAEAMAAALGDLQFNVIKGIDLDENGMRAAVNAFARAIDDAQVALLFYAGHGLQVDGHNYLLPVDAELNNEIDLQFQAVSIDFLLRVMEHRNRTSIVLLDACRDNPLATRLAGSISSARGRSIAPGLARVESGVGTYVGFATSPNSVALDGPGRNSPFTAALLRYIGEEGADIGAVMRHVREDVIRVTNGSQVPWGSSSLIGRGFVFRPAATEADAAVAGADEPVAHSQTDVAELLEAAGNRQARSPADKQVELTFWNSIKDLTDPRFFQAYLEAYPDGVFSGLARLKIAILTGQRPGSESVAPAPDAATAAADRPAPPDAEEASLDRDDAKPEPAPAIAGPTREQLRALQEELNRVGCAVGAVDGLWGRRSQQALEEFVRRGGIEVASVEPSVELLDLIGQQRGQICPRPARAKPAVRSRPKAPKAATQEARPDQGPCGFDCMLRRFRESNRRRPPGVDAKGG